MSDSTVKSTTATSGSFVAVIVNSASGSSVDEGTLRDAFAATDVETRWMPTTEDDPGTRQAGEAASAGAATVVACGGDGTVRVVLEGLAGSDVPMGIVPLGTGNLLASNLGLPTGLDAVPQAVGGTLRRLDLGVVNGERFSVMAGVGFDAIMIGETSSTLKRRVGPLAYVLTAVRNVGSLRSKVFRVQVTTDEGSWRGRSVLVLVGNCGTVTGGLEVFPDATADDGVLDVAVLCARGPVQWASVLWRLLRHSPQRPDLVHRMRGSTVDVRIHPPVEYELDGEIRPATSSLRFTVEPGSLLVRCGA